MLYLSLHCVSLLIPPLGAALTGARLHIPKCDAHTKTPQSQYEVWSGQLVTTSWKTDGPFSSGALGFCSTVSAERALPWSLSRGPLNSCPGKVSTQSRSFNRTCYTIVREIPFLLLHLREPSFEVRQRSETEIFSSLNISCWNAQPLKLSEASKDVQGKMHEGIEKRLILKFKRLA